MVEHEEPTRPERVDLAAEFTADRAARAGHQDAAALDDGADVGRGHVHLVAADQSVDVEAAHVGADHLPAQRGQEGGQVADGGAGRRRRGGEGPYAWGRESGDGQGDDLGPVLDGECGEVGERAEDGNAGGAAACFGRVVVEQADRGEPEARRAVEVADECAAGGSGPDHEGAQT